MLKNMKWFSIGFAICLIIVATTGMIFADAIEQYVNVSYNNIKVYVDNEAIELKDASGDIVEPFIYNGTTFLPVRAISEALGKEVRWDGDTQSVYIGEQPGNAWGSGDTEEPIAAPDPTDIDTTNAIIATIEMQDGGIIRLELYPKVAATTVANFVELANAHFYDGLTFHRVIEGFMIQGGDPEGTGMGGSSKTIVGEFDANGIKNNMSHKRGVISMARSYDMNSASSQFFIMHEDNTFLDGDYAAFGRVIEGMDVVDVIAENTIVEDSNGTVLPKNQPVIKSITCD